MSIASKTLKETGMEEEAKEMIERIINSRSYIEALAIISEYVEVL